MNLWAEKAAVALAGRLAGRVKYWAVVHVQGAFIDAHNPTEGANVTVNDMLAWADSPEAELGGKGSLMTFFRAVANLAKENERLVKENERLKSELSQFW